jgi:hypothetical protein
MLTSEIDEVSDSGLERVSSSIVEDLADASCWGMTITEEELIDDSPDDALDLSPVSPTVMLPNRVSAKGDG